MKKGSLLIRENSGTVQQVSELENFTSPNDHELLFVINPETQSLKFFNKYSLSFFNFKKEEIPGIRRTFFKNIIHPEDYCIFLQMLIYTRTNSTWNQSKIRILQGGSWHYFIFKVRIYKGFSKKELILCTATAAKDDGNENHDFFNFYNKEKEDKENEIKYNILLHSLEEGFGVLDIIFNEKLEAVDYIFLEVNEAFHLHIKLASVGKTRREIEVEHEDFWFNKYGDVALTGKASKFQKFSEKLDNSWFDLHAFPFGTKGQVAVLFRNITDKITAEIKLKKTYEDLENRIAERTNQLQQNKDLLQAVFDTSAIAIAVLQPVKNSKNEIFDFKILQVNKAFKTVYNASDIIGKSYSEISLTTVSLGLIDKLKNVIQEVKSLDYEVFYDQNGYNNWLRIRATPHHDILIFSFEDITKQKVEAQNLKESILFKRHIARTSPDIILILNIEKNFLRYANRDISSLIGKTKENFNSRTLDFLSYVHPREREKALTFHNNLLNAPDTEIVTLEFRFKTITQWQWYNARGKVFKRKKNGTVAEYLILLQDISEQKKIQKALIDAEKLSIKGEIARTLAHELRNPLASIGLASDVLRKKISDGHLNQTDNYLNIISRSAKLLNNLVNDLLNSSNYSSVDLKPTNLTEILEAALKQAADRIYLTGIKVIKNYSQEHIIYADEEKLKIAILNIIVNASEAMNPEEGILELKVEEDPKNVALTIADNGCGLEKEQLERLFDAFYTNKPTGVGVGLSSVKNILDEHDALIDVYSLPKKGTSFVISFHKG